MIGIVVGLTAEARVARPLGTVAVGGGDGAGASLAAERLVRDGAQALLSFGLAGGLDPALRPGALVLPGTVLDADGAWHATLLPGAAGRLYGGGTILASARDKAELHRRTGAAAVDLESAAVARVAARHALRFGVVRAVCDPAERDLPPASLMALDAAGRIGLWRVIRSVLAQPGQVPGLLALGRDAARARRALTGWVASVGKLG